MSRAAALGVLSLAVLALCFWACGDEPAQRTRAGISATEAPAEIASIVLPPLAAQPARAVALLVGIDRYAPGSEPARSPLRGCANDVRALERALLERFGFERANVRVLLDEEATHEAIVRAFCEHLIGRSGLGTEAVFFFAGHGSRVPDLSGDEGAEGFDSTYLAHDSRAGERAGEYDLSDDLLGALVAALAARGARPTVITDSCHSGGGLRSSGERRTRAVAPGARGLAREELHRVLPFFPREVETGAELGLALGAHTVHLAACADREQAQEVDVDGVPHGALSFALALALERATPATTYAALAHELAARMAISAPGQSAWAEGALERVLFGGEQKSLPGYACRAEGDLVLVQAGWMMGLAEGSRLAILDDEGKERVGLALVERVRATSASARWEEAPPEGARASGLRAIELERGAGQPLLRVRAEGERARALCAEIAGIELCTDGEEHDYLLRERDGKLALETLEGLVPWDGDWAPDDDRLAALLAEEVASERCWLALERLALDPGSLAVRARFREPSAAELESIGKGVRRALEGAGVASADGDIGTRWRAFGGPDDSSWRLAMIDLENPHARELHVGVLSLAEDRSRNLIWPERFRRDNRLAPGEKKSVGVGVLAGKNWRLARAMRDRYLVISTSAWADLSVFERRAALRSSGDGSDLPPLLRQTLRTDRGSRARLERDDWGVTTLDLEVLALSD